MIRFAVASLLALLAATASAGPEVRIADNVFLVPDANARSITLTMIVGAGCADEPHGVCKGISHYLEHLLFLGRNPDRNPVASAFFRDGVANGATSHLTTTYWDQFPARAATQAGDLDRLLGYFTQRLIGFEVTDADANRERNVVLQEYKWRVASRPVARFQTVMNAALLPDDPFAQQVAGDPQKIAAYSVADARAFHQQWYARNNATFVIYGPVEADAVKALVDKYLAPLPDKKLPERDWLRALRTFAPASETPRAEDPDVQRTMVEIDKIVRYEESDRARAEAARRVLNTWLGGRFDGAPHDRIVEGAGLTDEIGAIYAAREGAGALWLTIAAEPGDGVTPEKLAAGFAGYLTDSAVDGVPGAVVERIKKRLIEERSLSERDPEAFSRQLTQWFGQRRSYADFANYSADIADVTTEDVNLLLRALAGPGREIVGVLSPARASAQGSE